MSELDELKAHAAERRTHDHHMDNDLPLFDDWSEAEADLDRAIAIAEERIPKESLPSNYEQLSDYMATVENERDEARAAAEDWERAATATKELLDKVVPYEMRVRAAALALRNVLSLAWVPNRERFLPSEAQKAKDKRTIVLADTAWLEEYR